MSLKRWFDEKWVDVKTGKPCGRQKGEKRKGYPACRPSKRVSSKTPKTTKEMSSREKLKFKKTKTISKRINYNHKRRQQTAQVLYFNQLTFFMSKGVSMTKADKDPTGGLTARGRRNTTEQQVETCKLLLLKRQVFLPDRKQEDLFVQECRR